MKLQLWSRASTSGVVHRALRSESTLLSGGLMLGNAIAYVYQMLMSRVLSPADYGVVITLTAISYVLAVLVRTFQAWVITAVAESRTAGAGHLRAVFDAAMRALVPIGGGMFAALWLGSGWIAEFLHLRGTAPVVLLGLYAFSSILLPVACGMLLGLGRLHAASVVIVSDPISRLMVGMALIIWGLGVNGALFGYAAGNFVAFAVALMPLWVFIGRQAGAAEPAARFGSLDRYTLLALTANACLMIVSSTDQVAVKHFFSDEVAGNYAVAFLLGRVIALAAMSLSWVVFTRSATMRPDDPSRGRLLNKWLLAIGALAVALTAGYLILPDLAVFIMGGSQYDMAQAYVGLVGIEMTLFSLVCVQAYYQMSVRKMHLVWPLGLAIVLEVALLALYHDTVQQILLCLILVMAGLLACTSALSWWTLHQPSRLLSKAE